MKCARKFRLAHSRLHAYLEGTESPNRSVLCRLSRTPKGHGNTVHVHRATAQFVANLPVTPGRSPNTTPMSLKGTQTIPQTKSVARPVINICVRITHDAQLTHTVD